VIVLGVFGVFPLPSPIGLHTWDKYRPRGKIDRVALGVWEKAVYVCPPAYRLLLLVV